MNVKDMITRLRTKNRVEVRDEQGNELFTCDSDSTVLFDYWDREITEWFPYHQAYRVCDFTVYIKDKEVTE